MRTKTDDLNIEAMHTTTEEEIKIIKERMEREWKKKRLI